MSANSTFHRRQDIIDAFESQYPGVDFTAIYCLFTGAPIGNTHTCELEMLLDSLPGDPESAADDLAIRLFASMRPGLRWNKMRSESMEELRCSDPVGMASFLAIRAFKPLSGGSAIVQNHESILIYQRLTEMDFEIREELTHILLEIDAKNNLNSTYPTFSSAVFLAESDSEILARLREWYLAEIETYNKRQKQLEATSRWHRYGNTLANSAFAGSFMQDKGFIARLEEAKAAKLQRTMRKANPETRERKRKQSEMMAFLGDIFDSLQTDDRPGHIVATPAKKPILPVKPAPTQTTKSGALPSFLRLSKES